MSRAAIVDQAREIYEDVDFGVVRQWLAEDPARKAAGYLPVYAPKELIHACGMLPVGIHGGGSLEIIRGDAFYQSYICHLPRSVVELAQSGRLDMLSAVLFPSTCDVIRNLSGMFKLLYPDTYVRYIDVPQVRDEEISTQFWRHELEVLANDLGEVSGVRPDRQRLNASIGVYNRVRNIIRELYRARRDTPWKVPSEELYLLLRAGEVIPPETFIERAQQYLAAVADSDDRLKDRTRVIVVGAFCEQPPLGLIKTIERAGCWIVDDDFLAGNRFIDVDTPVPAASASGGNGNGSADPLEAMSRSFLRHAMCTSVLYEDDPAGKRRLMAERVKAAGADGIIFAAPSFCDPALLDRPMLRAGAEAAKIPCIAFQYSENTGQFQQFREQAGTFADSIKLWGEGGV